MLDVAAVSQAVVLRVVLGLPNSFLITVAASQAVFTIMCCSRATQFLYVDSDAFASCLDCFFPFKILFESYRKRAVYQVWQSKHVQAHMDSIPAHWP